MSAIKINYPILLHSLGLILIFSVFLCGCSIKPKQQSTATKRYEGLRVKVTKDPFTISSLMVQPVIVSEGAKECATHFDYNQELFRALTAETSLKLISAKIGSSIQLKDALISAKQAGLEGVLTTKIYTCVERSGSKLGSERGAIIGVLFKIVNLNGGESFNADFRIEDKPQLQNLLSLKAEKAKHPGFFSAHELYLQGINALANDIESRRQERFLSPEYKPY